MSPARREPNISPIRAQLPSLGVKNSNLNIAIFFAVIAAVILYIVLNKTTFGYELRATGFNKDAAEYAGMKSKRNIMLTMSLAGMLAGLGGAFAILAPSTIAGSSMTYEPISVIAGKRLQRYRCRTSRRVKPHRNCILGSIYQPYSARRNNGEPLRI